MPSRFQPQMDPVSLTGVIPLTEHWSNSILTIKSAHYRMFCSHCKLRTLPRSQPILSFLHSLDGPYPLRCSVTLYFARTPRVNLQFLGKSASSAPKNRITKYHSCHKMTCWAFLFCSTICFITRIHPLGYGADPFGKRT